MRKIVTTTQNMRMLLKGNLRFIRSDVPYRITERETQWLIANNVVTILDLRTEEERIKKACPLKEHAAFHYFCMPVTGGDKLPDSAEKVSQSNIDMADRQMEKIILKILSAKTNVLFFCNAGKDRTGVVSAILLWMMGISREYIVKDYLQSAVNLRKMLQDFVQQHPQTDPEIITPEPEYINEFLDWHNDQPGWRELKIKYGKQALTYPSG